jgi:acetate kinase
LQTPARARVIDANSPCLLAINGGSSSIRFAFYSIAERPRPRLRGKIERIGARGASLSIDDPAAKAPRVRSINAPDHPQAVEFLLDWLEAQPVFSSVQAVGHRVVHGMRHSEPERIDKKLLAELRRITPHNPEHLLGEVGLIEAIQRRHPTLPQVACFDTAFHSSMPRVARILPIPRRYAAKGLERYGFHGLSYAYLMEELTRLDREAAKGRVILAHLGNGASLAAVRRGQSIDTSMGFTPTSGLVMSTRTGDLDPGVAYYLARTEGMSAERFQQMVNRESGLRGVSGTSADLRDLLARETTDSRAAAAIELFCYQARKWIGSFAAALGGIETLVFSGGIGENAPIIRERICADLGFLGIELNRNRNAKSADVISRGTSRVAVRVIHTDEELMIARSVARLLGLTPSPGTTRP